MYQSMYSYTKPSNMTLKQLYNSDDLNIKEQYASFLLLSS